MKIAVDSRTAPGNTLNMVAASNTNNYLAALTVGQRVKISVRGLGYAKGTVDLVDDNGAVITGPRGGCTMLCLSPKGNLRAVKGWGSMSPKGGAVEGIELL